MSVVQLSNGKIQGTEEAHGAFFFGGIPYAAPPINDLRLKLPQEPAAWSGIRPAQKPGNAAPQRSCYGAIGELFKSPLPQSEDCLTLTVRSPTLSADRLPVFVWVHGGGFALGSGGDPLYQGGALSKRGVVEVHVNYRLGALGLATITGDSGDGVSNLALHDLVAALRWVQDNIEKFGGDPSNVTLGGHSAGAMLVACLLSSPSTRGLFARAIVQSASTPFAMEHSVASRVTRSFATELGASYDVDSVRAASLDNVLSAQETLCHDSFTGADRAHFGGSSLAFTPVVDGDFLTTDPISSLASGVAADVPVLVGSVRDEAMILLGPAVAAARDDAEVSRGVLDSALLRLGEAASGVESAYRRTYPDYSDARLGATILGDLGFRFPTLSFANAIASHSSVYCYRFDQESDAFSAYPSAMHGVELPYIFSTAHTETGRRLAGNVDGDLAEFVQTTWADFMTSGQPRLGPDQPWPCYDQDSRATVSLSAKATAVVADPPPLLPFLA